MTLIIGVLSEDYVALASDRRLSWYEGGSLVRQEDKDTKTINLNGQFIMGYTGLARLEGRRMGSWLAQQLAGVPDVDQFEVIAASTTRVFRKLGLREPHAYLSVGFCRKQKDSDYIVPALIYVSNSVGPDEWWTGQVTHDDFQVRGEPLGNRRHLVRHVGWKMPRKVERSLATSVRIATRGAPRDPQLIVPPLLTATRSTARVSRGHVGGNVLVSTLPKVAVPAQYVDVAISPEHARWESQPVSFFSRHTAPGIGEADFFSPALIMPNWSMTGIEVVFGRGNCSGLVARRVGIHHGARAVG